MSLTAPRGDVRLRRRPLGRPRRVICLMIDVSSGSRGSDFVRRLLTDKRMAVVPGDAFGPGSGRFVRISPATAADLLIEGVECLADAVEEWGG